MGKKATINVRIDTELKAQAEAELKKLDISTTKAISYLYGYVAQHGKLPFVVTQETTWCDGTVMKKVIA